MHETDLMPVAHIDGARIFATLLTHSTVREVSTPGVDNLAFLLLGNLEGVT